MTKPRPLTSAGGFSKYVSGLHSRLGTVQSMGGGQRHDLGLGPGSSRSHRSGGGDPANPEVAFSVVGAMREGMRGAVEAQARPLIQPRDMQEGWKQGGLPRRGDIETSNN